MNTQDKSLKLAELMGWMELPAMPQPYEDSVIGRAEFAAILLKYLEEDQYFFEGWISRWGTSKPMTQANILDEILRMNGVEL